MGKKRWPNIIRTNDIRGEIAENGPDAQGLHIDVACAAFMLHVHTYDIIDIAAGNRID